MNFEHSFFQERVPLQSAPADEVAEMRESAISAVIPDLLVLSSSQTDLNGKHSRHDLSTRPGLVLKACSAARDDVSKGIYSRLEEMDYPSFCVVSES